MIVIAANKMWPLSFSALKQTPFYLFLAFSVSRFSVFLSTTLFNGFSLLFFFPLFLFHQIPPPDFESEVH